MISEKTLGEMRIMGTVGDEKLTWDHADDIQIQTAKKKFQELLSKGYKAFISKDIAGQKKGEQITEFDPTAERLIMVPAMAGG